MPSLVFLGRRWNIGSDDFLLFPLLFSGLKVFWIVLILIEWGLVVGQFKDVEGCTHDLEIEVYLLTFVFLNTAFVCEELTLSYVSSRGGVLAPGRRRLVPVLLSVRLVLWASEVALTVFGTIVLSIQEGCASDTKIHEIVFDGLVICEWVVCGLYFCVGWLAYDPVGRRVLREGLATRHNASYTANWAKRLRRGCCAAEVDVEAYEEIAEIFANMFRNVDLVPSDIAVGLILLKQQQRDPVPALYPRRQSTVVYGDGTTGIVFRSKLSHDASRPSFCPSTPSTPFLSHDNTLPTSDIVLLRKLTVYMKYAMGAYGWPMYLLSNKSTGCCLLCKARCGLGQERVQVIDATRCSWCRCNMTAMDLAVGECDMVEWCERNTEGYTPYSVIVDHCQEAIVLTVRGTLSLQDLITDARAVSVSVTCDGVYLGEAHKGIHTVALNIKNDVLERGTVEGLLGTYPTYAVVLTGHSLGAGVASILACLLKGVFPDLRCYAFSPPGGLADKALALAGQQHVISVVFGKDFVPRLSEATIQELRDSLVEVLAAHGGCAKHRVLGTCGCCNYSEVGPVAGEDECKQLLRAHRERVANDNHETRTRMFSIGRLLHFVKDGSCYERPCLGGVRWKYSPLWLRHDELQEIVVSHEMISDHFPYANLDVLQSTLQRALDGSISEIPCSDLLLCDGHPTLTSTPSPLKPPWTPTLFTDASKPTSLLELGSGYDLL